MAATGASTGRRCRRTHTAVPAVLAAVRSGHEAAGPPSCHGHRRQLRGSDRVPPPTPRLAVWKPESARGPRVNRGGSPRTGRMDGRRGVRGRYGPSRGGRSPRGEGGGGRGRRSDGHGGLGKVPGSARHKPRMIRICAARPAIAERPQPRERMSQRKSRAYSTLWWGRRPSGCRVPWWPSGTGVRALRASRPVAGRDAIPILKIRFCSLTSSSTTVNNGLYGGIARGSVNQLTDEHVGIDVALSKTRYVLRHLRLLAVKTEPEERAKPKSDMTQEVAAAVRGDGAHAAVPGRALPSRGCREPAGPRRSMMNLICMSGRSGRPRIPMPTMTALTMISFIIK